MNSTNRHSWGDLKEFSFIANKNLIDMKRTDCLDSFISFKWAGVLFFYAIRHRKLGICRWIEENFWSNAILTFIKVQFRSSWNQVTQKLLLKLFLNFLKPLEVLSCRWGLRENLIRVQFALLFEILMGYNCLKLFYRELWRFLYIWSSSNSYQKIKNSNKNWIIT